MSLMRSPKQYRAYMNTPSPKATAVFPQSLSGSETDISTSNENLSNEEKYVIRHTERQEPQGEENLQSSSNRNSLRDSLPSNRSSLDVSSSSYNTLIIHSIGDESWTGRNSGPKDLESQYTNLASLKECPSPAPSPGVQSNSMFFDNPHGGAAGMEAGVQLTEIPDDYLSQSSVLKHLAKEVKMPSPEIVHRAPPEYSTYMKSRLPTVVMRKKNVRSVPLSKSQPDLRKIDKVDRMQRDNSVPRPRTNGREESMEKENMWTLEFLIKENHELKMELEKCYMRVSKSQKLEEEVLKIHRSHEELVQSCDRRERLERAARARLQSDCQRLQELNRTLKDQIGLLSNDGLRREVNKRELLITQLITQNKEFQAAKDRQEIELTAQRATLQEQRTHIDILEAALTNAQGNVVRLEEESRKKQVYVDRVVQLQRALSSLQLASDRREQTERQLRQQLENELERTKSGQIVDAAKSGGWGEHHHHSPTAASAENAELKKRLRDREEKIMRLEGECSKWEQRYLEESALRQAAIDAASIPKDAKIAALEKTSQETEKIIAEARNEKIRHMDEAHAAQKKVADLESRLKDLESKLAERDAMIRVLQKHTYDKDVSSMLSRSPHHTPHQSIGSSELDHVLGAGVSRDDLVSSVLTSSTSFGSGNSYAGSDSSFMQSYKYESKSFDSTKQTLDNQIKEIDNQLDSHMLSKRALCCFPGFANPVAAQRKGKIPKPLLASVSGERSATPSSSGGGGGGSGGGSAYDGTPFVLGGGGRHEQGDILLLEKQGRSSQQQRMSEQSTAGSSTNGGGSAGNSRVSSSGGGRQVNGNPNNLPPSSLPRPPRPKNTGSHRRLGEYNRLPDAGDLTTTPPPQPRKKSDGGHSLSSTASSRNASPARSLIPPPRKLGEYGRLSDSGASSSVSLRKPSGVVTRARSGERDSASTTFSDQSASSLPHPSKVRFYGGGARRSASVARDSKSSTDSTSSNKFRIQF